MVDQNRTIAEIKTRYPYILSVFNQLNQAGIKYAMFLGSHAALIGGHRVPSDVDLIIADEDIGKVKGLFPFAVSEDWGNSICIYIGRNKDIELISNADVYVYDAKYTFRYTELAQENSSSINFDGIQIKTANPVDTILFKSMLRRGVNENKYDIEDIAAIMKSANLDPIYFEERFREIGGDENLRQILRQLNVVK